MYFLHHVKKKKSQTLEELQYLIPSLEKIKKFVRVKLFHLISLLFSHANPLISLIFSLQKILELVGIEALKKIPRFKSMHCCKEHMHRMSQSMVLWCAKCSYVLLNDGDASQAPCHSVASSLCDPYGVYYSS